MIESFEIVVQVLVLLPAVYVGVLYLQEEDGPFAIFKRIRKLAGYKEEEIYELSDQGEQVVSVIEVPGSNFWSRVLQCHRCLSPYVSFLIVLFGLVVGFLTFAPEILLIWFSLTGSAVYLFERGA